MQKKHFKQRICLLYIFLQILIIKKKKVYLDRINDKSSDGHPSEILSVGA